MDKTYKALSDPSRREILRLLREQDLTAGEIVGQIALAPLVASLELIKFLPG